MMILIRPCVPENMNYHISLTTLEVNYKQQMYRLTLNKMVQISTERQEERNDLARY
jgi:hypothetical protein